MEIGIRWYGLKVWSKRSTIRWFRNLAKAFRDGHPLLFEKAISKEASLTFFHGGGLQTHKGLAKLLPNGHFQFDSFFHQNLLIRFCIKILQDSPKKTGLVHVKSSLGAANHQMLEPQLSEFEGLTSVEHYSHYCAVWMYPTASKHPTSESSFDAAWQLVFQTSEVSHPDTKESLQILKFIHLYLFVCTYIIVYTYI